jgi:hypothetical protein
MVVALPCMSAADGLRARTEAEEGARASTLPIDAW